MSESPFTFRGSASVHSHTRGSDTGHLVITGGGWLLFAVAAGLYTYSPTWICGLGACVGVGLMLLGGLGWYRARNERNRSDAEATQLVVRGDETHLRASPALGRDDLMALLRMVVQSRQPLPPPHGAVLGTPQDSAALHVYQKEEAEAAAAQIRSAEQTHESQANGLVRRLSDGDAAAKPPMRPGVLGTPRDPDETA